MKIEHKLTQAGLGHRFVERSDPGHVRCRARSIALTTGVAGKSQQVVMSRAFGGGSDGDIRFAAVGDGRIMAAKSFRVADKAEALQIALKEARLLVRFGDPSAHVIVDTAGTPYVLMRLATADLHALRCTAELQPPLHSALARKTLADVAGQLAHVHRRGYTHRDVKPGNILCYPDGMLRLADFGRARDLGEGRRSGTSGTVMFAPLEVIYAGETIASHSDIWSLGMTLLDTLVGLGESPLNGEYAKIHPAVAAMTLEDLLELRSRIRASGAKMASVLKRDTSPWAPYLRKAMKVDAELTRLVLQTMLAPPEERISADALVRASKALFPFYDSDASAVQKLCARHEAHHEAERATGITLACTYDAVIRKRYF